MFYAMERGKRGVETPATPVSGFLLLMLLFFVLYIVIIAPASEKEKLLYGDKAGQNTNYPSAGNAGNLPNSQSFTKTLMTASPGVVVPAGNAIESKPIDSARLYLKDDSITKTIANDIVSKAGLFRNNPAQASFRLDNVQNIRNVKLYFTPITTEGKLKINLNGQEIYNRKVMTNELPIELPLDLLKSTNRIEFVTDTNGVKIFGVDENVLKNVQLVIKMINENVFEERSFVLTKDEKNDLRRMTLYFMTNCMKVEDNGILNVYLNDRLVSTREVVCDIVPTILDLDKLYMMEGRNIIRFEITNGDYVLEQMVLEKELDRIDFPVFFFPVQAADYDGIARGLAYAFLEMSFNDDGLRKKATIFVNGERVYLDTYAARWGIDATPFSIEGENFVKIIPNTEFEILDL